MEFLEPPFDKDIHLHIPPISVEHAHLLQEFRSVLESSVDHYNEEWCSDHILHSFLIARKYNLKDATSMIAEALAWRDFRKPHHVPNWEVSMKKESETGKIYCPGTKIPPIAV